MQIKTEKKILHDYQNALDLDYGAKFYKVDLHFHTPASEDARSKERYDFNPFKEKFPNRKDDKDYNKAVADIHAKILAGARKIAADIVEKFIKMNLSMVAITDHNSIGTIWSDDESEKPMMDLVAPTWYELIDDEAQKVNREAGKTILTILPGVEISTTGMHLLAIFPPQKPRRKVHFIICDLLNEIGFEIDEWGKNPKVGKASAFNAINLVVRKGGLPIPAHIDARNQAMLKLFSINSVAMKDVLRNKHLSAVEIVNPLTFSVKNQKLKKPINEWIFKVREKDGLLPFAYFQGSDAHCIEDIAKKTYLCKNDRAIVFRIEDSN